MGPVGHDHLIPMLWLHAMQAAWDLGLGVRGLGLGFTDVHFHGPSSGTWPWWGCMAV